jgi:cobalt-zinc-cadmium efflux system membrane fusion protein
MLSWSRRLVAWAGSQLPTLVTLAALVGLAVWGAKNDWKIPHAWGASPRETGKENAGANKADATDVPAGESATASLSTKPIVFPSDAAIEKAGIKWEKVQLRAMPRYVVANASIDYEPSLYARLTARATGTVWRMEKEVGDKVSKGEVIALIDSAEVGKVKAEFLQSLAQVRLRTGTLQQLQSLGDNGAISQRSLRDAETSLREARIRLFNDQQALLNLGLSFRLKDVENLPEEQLVRYLRLLGVPESMRKNLDLETSTANLLPLIAPFDGQVVQRFAALGDLQQVTQPKPMYVVADIRELHFEIDVNPEDIGALKLGQKVTFRREGESVDAAAGKLSHISPEVDEKTRRIRVHAEFTNPTNRLRPNTFGNVRILVGEHAQATVVPSEAVQLEGSTHFVFVRASETTFRARPVQTGLREGNLLEVTGVRPGEEVVTTGSFMLKSELLKDKIVGGDD